MEEPKPSRRIVDQRIRNRIIEYFDLAASYEVQLAYEERVPIVNVPYEVINQWEDWVPPLPKTPVHDLGVFTAEELCEIANFRPVWDAAARAIGKDFPAVASVQSLPEWDRLRRQAASAALVFQERGLLPEDREAATPQPSQWITDQIDAFTSLEGRTIASWRGVEMAFSGGENDLPALFEDPSVPCLQFLRLEAELIDGTTFEFSRYQNNDGWGLFPESKATPFGVKRWDGIYRYAERLGLPTGVITEVKLWVADSGDLAEVALDIGGQELLFVAGEVYEDWNRPPRLGWLDESVLVFVTPEDADNMNWISSRQPHRYSAD